MENSPHINEEFISKIPALTLLMALGYTYIKPTDCLEKRGSTKEVILKDELIAFLQRHKFEHKGELYPLSQNAVEQIFRELTRFNSKESLLFENKRMYHLLTLGFTVTEFIQGQKVSTTVKFIDFEKPENNIFTITEEMEVQSTYSTHTRRPDIVLFVNGFPLVVIEAKQAVIKEGKKSVNEAISQHIRNQKEDEIPHLFAFSQILLAVSSIDAKYATTGTNANYWQSWNEEKFIEEEISALKNRLPSKEQEKELFSWRKDKRLSADIKKLWEKSLFHTEQDRLIISLLSKERLLDLIQSFIVFDIKKGKILARYPQYFGIKAMFEQLEQKNNSKREGGVIWHTTGAGKSLVMVLFCNALLLNKELAKCKIILVLDRVDLQEQLISTFRNSNALGSIFVSHDSNKARVASGKELALKISKGEERIIFTLMQKFKTAVEMPFCKNESADIIVLIDEGHRSQKGENHIAMKRALPNAAFFAFTGTPLLRENETIRRFGKIIHAYSMGMAVKDKAVVPLLYEAREPQLAINAKAIDNSFNKITENLSESEINDLKHKYSTTSTIYGSDDRIRTIAEDISEHFLCEIRTISHELKAQLATDSRISAIRYKNYLDEIDKVSSAIVMSSPDTREGNKEVAEDARTKSLVNNWYEENIRSNPSYEENIIQKFGTNGSPDILIVVDKLLTGFDEPRNAVLYIDKPLEGHNLIQAIARVNRLHEDKQVGLLIDYRGVLSKLEKAVEEYNTLENLSELEQEINDISTYYQSVDTEYLKLPQLHKELWNLFAHAENKYDIEQLRATLLPKLEKVENKKNEFFDSRLKAREDFYAALTQFALCLNIALASQSFYNTEEGSPEKIKKYKQDLALFEQLRKVVRQDAHETIDFSKYEDKIKGIIDRYVVSEGIEVNKEHFLVNELGKVEDPNKWSEIKLRNESEQIKSRAIRTLEIDLACDPVSQKHFSELLQEAISKAEKMFDHPFDIYGIFKDFEMELKKNTVPEIPQTLQQTKKARGIYGVFLMQHIEDKEERLISEALFTDEVIARAQEEFSITTEGMEAEIRKILLPRFYTWLGREKALTLINELLKIIQPKTDI